MPSTRCWGASPCRASCPPRSRSRPPSAPAPPPFPPAPPDRGRPREPSMMPPRDLRLALVGFGHVGRRFAERLLGPYGRGLRAEGLRARVTGIATARHGIAIDPGGLDIGRALRLLGQGSSLSALDRGPSAKDVLGFIAQVPADVL